MPFLIDGDNLLGTWPERSRSDGQRQRLAAELGRLSRLLGRRVVVVFDGPRPAGLAVSNDVHYAGAGGDADSVLVAWLRREREPREWTLVTSDRALGDRCRHLGAAVERSDQFRRRLARPTSEEKPDREVDVAGWKAAFGEE